MAINYFVKQNAAVIVLNRPDNLNTLTFEMIQKINKILDDVESTDKIKLVIFTGAGDKAFCAGGDVKSFYEEKFTSSDKLRKNFFYHEYKLNHKISIFSKPIVSLVHGICMGGGVGLAMHGNIVVISEKVTFAMPETAIGLFPDVGAGKILTNLDGDIGMYLALTGQRINSGDLLSLGLAYKCVSRDKFEILEKELSMASGNKEIMEIIDSYSIELDPVFFPKLNSEINDCFKYDTVEEVIKAIEKNDASWAKESLNSIYKMSPTSIKITFKQLKMAKKMSLSEDLTMEYRMSQGCMRGHDFYEGVRAVLIDKDHKPKWNPKNLEDVSEDMVLEHFKVLEKDDLIIN